MRLAGTGLLLTRIPKSSCRKPCLFAGSDPPAESRANGSGGWQCPHYCKTFFLSAFHNRKGAKETAGRRWLKAWPRDPPARLLWLRSRTPCSSPPPASWRPPASRHTWSRRRRRRQRQPGTKSGRRRAWPRPSPLRRRIQGRLGAALRVVSLRPFIGSPAGRASSFSPSRIVQLRLEGAFHHHPSHPIASATRHALPAGSEIGMGAGEA